jgi:phospho-N-acetylmuramoyl-pentapeptide-transferase
MLFNLLTSLIDQYSFLNVFKYLTFRTGLSVVTSLYNCIYNWRTIN